jgi:hypothetical protein
MHRRIALTLVLVAGLAAPAAAATPAQSCRSNKNKEAGKYASCRQKVEAKLAITGDPAGYAAGLAKCTATYDQKWPLIETKAAGACPSASDQGTIQGMIDANTTAVATVLAGGAASAPAGQRLKTGQTTCTDAGGAAIPCAGTGQDGEVQKGLTQTYVDNGDGTITDTRTGLMWEKQSDDGTLNDRDTLYTWANAFAVKIAGLNGTAFAGHSDWRLPNVNELQSLVRYGVIDPSISAAFNTACVPGCSLAACACTREDNYWTSTSYDGTPLLAWYVNFADGFVFASPKTDARAVRGVRGGS